MSGVFRVGVRFLNRSTPVKPILESRVCGPLTISSCHISGKTMRGSKLSKPAPFPYLEKEYSALQACKDVLFKSTTSRFDENTKVGGMVKCMRGFVLIVSG